MSQHNWYQLKTPGQIDSPALLIYPDRISKNISEMICIAGSPERLIPHVKTHKMPEIVKMQIQSGIHRFKCATIAEAEMLAQSGAKQIILAYQLNETKALRYLQLIKQYPEQRFASLIDNLGSAKTLNSLFEANGLLAKVYIDIDNGMHRTGFPVKEDIVTFFDNLNKLPNIDCLGLHVYDGQFREQNFQKRTKLVQNAFVPIQNAAEAIIRMGFPKFELIAGGSPTFSVHALNTAVNCSPGTCLLWDKGYGDLLTEQHFLHAAVVFTRIISKPGNGRITTDLGHKSVAAENPIDKRVFLQNMENYKVISQSEEHLVLEVDDQVWQKIKVGDVLYGIPYHICPTVALYDEAQVVEDGKVVGQWQISARKKKINV